MSILIVIGPYGGFHLWSKPDWSKRVCLGWLAITIYPCDIERAITKIMREDET
jgi:hypothetical protein